MAIRRRTRDNVVMDNTRYEVWSYDDWYDVTEAEFNACVGAKRVTYNCDQLPKEK